MRPRLGKFARRRNANTSNKRERVRKRETPDLFPIFTLLPARSLAKDGGGVFILSGKTAECFQAADGSVTFQRRNSASGIGTHLSKRFQTLTCLLRIYRSRVYRTVQSSRPGEVKKYQIVAEFYWDILMKSTWKVLNFTWKSVLVKSIQKEYWILFKCTYERCWILLKKAYL